MLDHVKANDLFSVQNQVETQIIELIRYVVIEAVKHGHELSTFKFCQTMNELDRVKTQKTRLIDKINESDDESLSHLVKEILQADLLVDAKRKKA